MTSRMMAAVKSKDTKPELAVRSALWRRGYRYSLHRKDVVGRPDLIFRRARVAVFIDGDFWHGNAWRVRGLSRLEDLFPTRTEWWAAKIKRNIARDHEVTERLRAGGWLVLRFWESEVAASVDAVADEIAHAVDSRR